MHLYVERYFKVKKKKKTEKSNKSWSSSGGITKRIVKIYHLLRKGMRLLRDDKGEQKRIENAPA